MFIEIDEKIRARIDEYRSLATEAEWQWAWGSIITDCDVINLALKALDREVETRRVCARLDKHPMYRFGGEDEHY